ncbi:MAG: PQQ-binding-like beta-propeller repeat protein [Planctomycetaceae bacterium]|nr:PQQ-binding-like beta-propeller repeat protein [Planctomycetaceae bacterium]
MRHWPGWRGPDRSGRAAWLPDRLPKSLNECLVWSLPLPTDGLGGIAAAEGFVIVGGRDIEDQQDVFLFLDAESGFLLGQVSYPALGSLDYGNAPRATPLITPTHAYLFGAFGHTTCVDLAAMETVWQRDLSRDYQTPELEWGLAGSPLLVDDLLIVQPGGRLGNLIALESATGKTRWTSEGGKPGHTSCILVEVAGRHQLVGYDATSLGGWDLATGERLWTITPPTRGDFNVPTPIWDQQGQALIVSTENNGTRRYTWSANGQLQPDPVAQFEDLSPDSHSPVLSAGRVYGVCNGLHAIEAATLKPIWIDENEHLYDYASLIVSGKRLLVLSVDGHLRLIEDAGETFRVLGELSLSKESVDVLSHPALAGTRLFVRLGRRIVCLELGK